MMVVVFADESRLSSVDIHDGGLAPFICGRVGCGPGLSAEVTSYSMHGCGRAEFNSAGNVVTTS